MDPHAELRELLEAREQTDAGLRLALPQFAERVGIGERPDPKAGGSIDHDQAKVVGHELMVAKEAIARAAQALDLDGALDIHLAFNGIDTEIDRVGGELASRWSA